MSNRRPSGRYREAEVRYLIENYAVTLEAREVHGHGLLTLVKVADLKRGWRNLRPDDKHVLLLLGVAGLTQQEAGDILERPQQWVGKRYRLALEELTWQMNGGIE